MIASKRDLKKLLHAIDDDLSGTIDCWELVNYIDTIMADEFTYVVASYKQNSANFGPITLSLSIIATTQTPKRLYVNICSTNLNLNFPVVKNLWKLLNRLILKWSH